MTIFERRENFLIFVRRYPAVTLLTLAIIVIQLATYYYGKGPTDLETARRFGAMSTADTSPNEWFRLATSIFEQIGGTPHLLGNAACLIILGPPLENIYGSAKFTFLFFITGIIGGIFNLVLSTDVISAGASGSIFGLLGLYLGLMIKRNSMIDSSSKKVIWGFLALNLVFTFIVPNISIPDHMGGLVSGITLPFFIKNQSFRGRIKTTWGNSIFQVVIVTVLIFSLLYYAKNLPDSANLSGMVTKFDSIKLVETNKLNVFQKYLNTEKVANDFEIYNNDGFSIQYPTDWKDINTNYSYSLLDQYNTEIDFKKKPISKKYQFDYLRDNNYTMELTIEPYNKTIDPLTFLKNKEITADKFKEVSVTNADKAYEYIDYKDDIRQQSTRILAVFKNDVFYELYASHEKPLSEGGNIEYDRNNIQKFRKDIGVMFSSFQLTNKGIEIKDILKEQK